MFVFKKKKKIEYPLMPQFRPNKTKRILKIMGEKMNKICQYCFRIKVTQRKLILADQKAEEDIKRRERERDHGR